MCVYVLFVLQEEEMELAEFERLERAAMESSFSSQCSLLHPIPVVRPRCSSPLSSTSSTVTHTQDHVTHPQLTASSQVTVTQPYSTVSNQITQPWSAAPSEARSTVSSQVAQLLSTASNHVTQSGSVLSSNVTHSQSMSSSHVTQPQSRATAQVTQSHQSTISSSVTQPATSGHGVRTQTHKVLSPTPPSLATGVEFEDDEAWDSFNSGSPMPPPSALVAKLFPALRRDRETVPSHVRKEVLTHTSERVKSSARSNARETIVTDAATEDQNMAATKGHAHIAMGEMSEQVRQKLALLESEIERFKSENSRLERLRQQKEQVGVCVCVCVCHCHQLS